MFFLKYSYCSTDVSDVVRQLWNVGTNCSVCFESLLSCCFDDDLLVIPKIHLVNICRSLGLSNKRLSEDSWNDKRPDPECVRGQNWC
jgi:hypothetical protein